ncbi:YbaN family protein [Candidatus Bathyarchaeota archaeon]|nr:YbaN family protein [Candidatus Bathyarchaeota archaeon]
MSLSLGVLGTVLLILPTTPFLLLSVSCYCRSSERMYRWMLNNKLFGKYISN